MKSLKTALQRCSSWSQTLQYLPKRQLCATGSQVIENTQNAEDDKLSFKTDKSNPAEHTLLDRGLFYTLDKKESDRFLKNMKGVHLMKMEKIFQELCIMVRKPALEIIDILNKYDYSSPVPRVILYGRLGAGKSFTMYHIMHYCYKQNWVILSVPWVNQWSCKRLGIAFSNHHKDMFDLPVHSKLLLEDFLHCNQHLIKDFKTSTTYHWSTEEATEEGTLLTDLIEFGTIRVKFANDVVDALIKELQNLANNNEIKLLIALEGVNAFWRNTGLKIEKVKKITAQQLSLVQQFQSLITSDTKNAIALCTIDGFVEKVGEDRKKYLPMDLLGKEGFSALEPFLPIEVSNYDDTEVQSCTEYYQDRMWIQSPEAKTPEGKEQLKFLSGKNPYNLFNLCSPL